MKNYTIEEHTHRFAVWTSARAASKSRLKNSEVQNLMESIKLRQRVEMLRNEPLLNDEYYHNWIFELGTKLVIDAKLIAETDFKRDQFTFGVAAKIISIYIKTAEVLPTCGKSNLSAIAYPPIDGILIRNFNAANNMSLRTAWSKFEWEDYKQVILAIRDRYPGVPMWQVESLWAIGF